MARFVVAAFLALAAHYPMDGHAYGQPKTSALATTLDEGPGPYVVKGPVCGDAGCDAIPGRWRATASVDVYERPDSAAPVVARVPRGEWVKAVEKETRFIPQRGVVRSANGGSLSAGDVVFGPIGGDDEESYFVWSKGRKIKLEATEQGPQIDWAESAPDKPFRVQWVRIERTEGPGGWLRDPADFECMGDPPAGDEAC